MTTNLSGTSDERIYSRISRLAVVAGAPRAEGAA
jgi:hypothetical protein